VGEERPEHSGEAIAAGTDTEYRGETDKTALLWTARTCPNLDVIHASVQTGANLRATGQDSVTQALLLELPQFDGQLPL